MPPRSRHLIGLAPLPRALRLLATLTQDQFEELARAISTPRAFTSDWDRAGDLAATLGVDDAGEIATLLSSLEFLYERSHTLPSDSSDPASVLQDFLRLSGLWPSLGSNPNAAFDRLRTLLAPNAAADRQRKRQWLIYGIIENASSFASFVDLRPNFARDRSSVAEFIPVVLFRVSTETDDEREYSYTFQMTHSSLLELKDVIDDTLQKLNALKDDPALASRVSLDLDANGH